MLHPNLRQLVKSLFAICLALVAGGGAYGSDPNQVAGKLITLNSNGAWSWYMDERVIVDASAGKLLASSVANAGGTDGARRNGDIDVVSYDFGVGQPEHFVLHSQLQADDHNAAALLLLRDGRYLAFYTKHGSEKVSYYRISAHPHDASNWQPEQKFDWSTTPDSDFNVTYSNLFYLPAESRIYNFVRANNRSPNLLVSNDDGATWKYGGKLLWTPVNVGYVNGYLKYASNGRDRIDFIATEHHPRDFNNSIFHGYIQAGKMHCSDGTVVDENIFDDAAPSQSELTKVFASDPEDGSQKYSRAWTIDLHADQAGNPYAIISTRANDVPVNTQGYQDHRFWYARYDGKQWHVHQLAKAGARLYPSEQDYTGLVALDPHDPNVVYVSSTIDPRDETALRVHELFRGTTTDGGATWTWSPITLNSQMDNLRPTVPLSGEKQAVLVWMRGTYRTMHDYDLDIVALTELRQLVGSGTADSEGQAGQ